MLYQFSHGNVEKLLIENKPITIPLTYNLPI